MKKPFCQGGTVYTIQANDTFYLLSQRFHVSLEAILAANPGADPYNLQIGQRVCIPQGKPFPPDTCSGFLHVIQSGDTFYKLSKRFNVPLDAILAANPGADPYNLQIGQKVCIPKGKPPKPECPDHDCPKPKPPKPPEDRCSGFYYTVKAGDTLFNLAERFGVTVKEIQDANPGLDPRHLAIGQRICIPKKQCPKGTSVYVVKKGDTLSSIAHHHGTTVQAIIKANPGIDPNNLSIGQEVCVPKKY